MQALGPSLCVPYPTPAPGFPSTPRNFLEAGLAEAAFVEAGLVECGARSAPALVAPGAMGQGDHGGPMDREKPWTVEDQQRQLLREMVECGEVLRQT